MKKRAAIPLLAPPEPPSPSYAVIKSGLVTWRAWFYPRGPSSWDEELLGEYLSEADARAACDSHAKVATP